MKKTPKLGAHPRWRNNGSAPPGGNLDPGLKFKAKIEGKIDDPVIKLNAEDAQLVTITLYPTTRNITIQGNYISEWTKYEFTNLKELTDGVTQFDEIPWHNEWFLRNVPEVKAQKKQTKNGELTASAVAKEQKSASDKIFESEEEMKHLQQAIELLENNCISLKTENKELHKKVDDLTSRISQLEEAFKAIEKSRNDKPEKEKQAQKETTTIGKLQQHQLMQQEDILKINKEIAKIKKSIQEKIHKSASTTQNYLDKKLTELQNDFRNHQENINRLKEDFGSRTPLFSEDDINQMINECVTQKLEERSNFEEKQSEYTWTATAKQIDTEKKEKPVQMERKEWAEDEEALDDIHDDRSSISENASWNKSANNKLEHLIIGDSIIQNISSDKFHKGKKTKIITQRGKGIDNVMDYLHQTELDPKNLIIHTGSNDIANMDVDNVKEKFESLFDIIIKKFKNSKVYISVPINRYGNSSFNRNISKLGTFIKEICIKNGGTFMFHNNINKDETCFRSDNIHLSNKGTGILVANMKSHLRGQANGRRGPEAKGNQSRQLRQNSTDQTNMLKNFLQGFLKTL